MPSSPLVRRLIHAAVALAGVVATFGLYSVTVVPLVDPASAGSRAGAITDVERAEAERSIRRQVEQLAPLFAPGAWELDQPKILESDQVKLLMRDYENLGENGIRIYPCTLIYTPQTPGLSEEQRLRNAVVLEAPEGAVLKFEDGFNLPRMKVGRLVGGELLGPITIRSQGKLPGAEDDLWITTNRVRLDQRAIWTDSPVEFRWGSHYGRGHRMTIRLVAVDRPGESRSHGPSVAGIDSFEITQVDRLHLELGGALGRQGADDPAAPPPSGSTQDLPVEVTCAGPFRFDVGRKVATFEHRVQVWRIHPDGPADQLVCDLLSIHFDEAPRGEAETSGSPRLVARRIEAAGLPVVLVAPAEQVHARGHRLEYDFVARRIVLDGGGEVSLSQGPNEVRAPSLQYRAAEPGRLGEVVAAGPGRLSAPMDGKPDERLEARWNDRLLVRPHEQNHVISLLGGADLDYTGFGRLQSDEIHFWLTESPPDEGRPDDARPGRLDAPRSAEVAPRYAEAAPRQAAARPERRSNDPVALPKLQPDRMLAVGNVRLGSARLSGTVEELRVWFEPNEKPGGLPWRASFVGNPAGDGPAGDAAVGSPAAGRAPAGHAPAGRPWQPPGDAPPPSPAGQPADESSQHFEVTARLLLARVALGNAGQAEIARLILEDNVQLVETRTGQPGEAPLRVAGDRVEAFDPQQPHGAVTVTGRPAHFEARGLGLTGSNINLHRGTNQVWIDGPGRMDLPLERDLLLRGQPDDRTTAVEGHLEVVWQARMVFDGRTARFEEAVAATRLERTAGGLRPMQQVRTETLEAQFRQPIRFDQPDAGAGQPELEQILCRGGVSMDGYTSGPEGVASRERIEVTDLSLNLRSGALTAGGPGWLSTVRVGADEPWNATAAARPAATGAAHGALPARTVSGGSVREGADTARAGEADGGLKCLHVRFEGSISGNLHARQLTFHDRVRAIYAPVDDWQTTVSPDAPGALGSDAFALRCERLTVVEMPRPLGGGRSLELDAAGNAVAEGQGLTARALRMTYDEAKDLLVLEGDGRTDAELFWQQQVGGAVSTAAARKIHCWPKTRRVRVEGARSVDLTGFPGVGGKRDVPSLPGQ